MPVILGIGSAASGIISGITGLSQQARAKKMAAQNQRPTYQVPDEILKNQKIAEMQSTQGLPSSSMELAKQNIAQQTSAALSSAKDKQGGLESVGAIVAGANASGNQLASEDANMRMANISNLMKQNQVLAGYKDQQFNYNQDQKYQENAAAIRALNTAGAANINAGISGVLGAGADMYSASKGNVNPSDNTKSPDLTGQMNVFNWNKPQIDKSLIPKDPTTMPDFFGSESNTLNWLQNLNVR